MLRRHLTCLALLIVASPAAWAFEDSEFYLPPKTVPEFWRAARFEIRTGNYERAADRIKSLLALNPDSKTLFELIDAPPPGIDPGMAPILRLRNIPRWSADARADKQAKAQVEDLIDRISKALEAELKNPVRIRRFATALSSEAVEEAAFALKEIQRSGEAVVPVLATMLSEKLGEKTQAGILMAIPNLGLETVPGFVAFLAGCDPSVKGDLIDALRKRSDFRTLAVAADRDPVPTLLYIWGQPNMPEAIKTKAKAAMVAATAKDIEQETTLELRSAPGQLTATAQRFYDGTSNLTKLAGDDKNDAVHKVWVWDGKTLVDNKVTRFAAAEYYGLRYARWALELQPTNVTAQKTFFGIAIENQVLRTGGDQPLSKTSPELHTALIATPYTTLAELLEESLRDRKTAVALAAVRAIGERADSRAARPSPKPGAKDTGEGNLRPALLVQAMDYPDPRVQFAAVDALLRIPGTIVDGKDARLPVHGRNDDVVKILTGAVLADAPAEGKQKVLLADPDSSRADGVSLVLQRLGYEVEAVTTGRQLMRRIQEKSDIDLVLLDRHIPNPLLGDLVAQLKADRRGKTIPTMILASPDGVIPVNFFSALARLASIVAFEDLTDSPWYNFYPATKDEADKIARLYEEMTATIQNRYHSQRKRMRELVVEAGFKLTPEIENRIDYLTLQTFPTTALSQFGTKFLDEERILVFRLLPADIAKQSADAPTRPLKGRIRGDSIPTASEAERIINLMRITGRHETVLPVQRVPGFNKVWNAFWSIEEPRLPLTTALRSTDVELKLNRQFKGYRGLRVIPSVFTDESFKEELAQLTDAKAPLLTAAEKKEYAKTALTWIKKMALGEVPGYRVSAAEPALRFALQSDDLAPLAIEAAPRFASRELQQDLANVVVKEARPAPIRVLAAEVLAKHVQSYGKFVTDAQVNVLKQNADAAADPELKSRILAVLGSFASDSGKTGDQLKGYTPKPVMKEEGKVDEKKEPEEKK